MFSSTNQSHESNSVRNVRPYGYHVVVIGLTIILSMGAIICHHNVYYQHGLGIPGVGVLASKSIIALSHSFSRKRYCSTSPLVDIYDLRVSDGPNPENRTERMNPKQDVFRPIENRGRKSSLEGTLECIEALKSSQEVQYASDIIFPEIKSDAVRIPFYIIPDFLPESARLDKETSSWQECWKEWVESDGFHNNKRIYGYYAAKELENHRWRVYHPEEALIYLIPAFDYTQHSPKPECTPCFNYSGYADALEKVSDPKGQWAKYLSPANTLIFMGDWHRYANWNHWPRLGTDFEEVKDKESGEIIDRRTDDLVSNPILAWFLSDPFQFGVKSTKIFMPDPVTGSCVPGHETPACTKIDEWLEEESILSPEAWLDHRPLAASHFGQLDYRIAYTARRGFDTAVHLKMASGEELPLPGPLIAAETTKIPRDSALISSCTIEERPPFTTVDEVKKYLDDYNSSCQGYPSLMMQVGHKSEELKKDSIYGDRLLQDHMRLRSKFVFSFRGDTIQSQRSYEGLLTGSITAHDLSEQIFAYTATNPMHIPWRLLGLYDNDLCIWRNSQQIWYTSGRRDILSMGTSDKEEFSKRYKAPDWVVGMPWSNNDLTQWSNEFFDCFDPVSELAHDPTTIDVMRRAIVAYRRDILWEVPGSRTAENIIFEATRMMDRHEPNGWLKNINTWDTFRLSSTDFDRPSLPSECLLGGGELAYDEAWGLWNADPPKILKKYFKEDAPFW